MSDLAVHVLNLDGNIVSLIALFFCVVGQILWIISVQQINEPVREVFSTDRNLRNKVRDGITFVNGHSVSDAFSSIEHCSSCAASGEQR